MVAGADLDAMEMLNKKIRELEAKNADENAKAQKLQKGRAKKVAKSKLKEAKQLIEGSEMSPSEKAQKLWAAFQEQQELAIKLSQKSIADQNEMEKVENECDAGKEWMNRSNAAKEKLESLCAQLQQQTKALADEGKRVAEKERLKRQELADEFQQTIGEVKKKVDEQVQERVRSARENEELRSKFKQFFERYDKREKELNEEQKRHEEEAKELEGKLTEQVQTYRTEAHREATAQRENDVLTESENALRAQLQAYSSKFGQFQDALTKSDKVFAQYKRRRNKMERRVETLLKENAELRNKNDKKITATKKDRDQLLKDKEALQIKCKQLQAERLGKGPAGVQAGGS